MIGIQKFIGPFARIGVRKDASYMGFRSFSDEIQAKASLSEEQMLKDKRYKSAAQVPDSVLKNMHSSASHGFSIRGEFLKGRPAYMDFQATTPMDPRVLDAMLPYMVGRYGNPHSRSHSYGWETERAVEEAREHIASLIGASPKEIIFTSGATESNNLALKGTAHFYREKKNHIITVQTEHKCILDSCRHLETQGYTVTYLPVQGNGLLDMKVLQEELERNGSRTVAVSVMGVNNEIGVIQPLKEIGEVRSVQSMELKLTPQSCVVGTRYSSTLISLKWRGRFHWMWTA